MAPNVEVVDLKYTRLGHPHLGRVNDAVLTLRGPIFEIDMPYGSVYERTWLTSTNAPGRNLASLNDQPEYRISTFGDYDSRGAAPGFDKRCEALVLYDRDMQEGSRSRSKGYGIILLKVSEEEYTRVGSFLILVPDDTTDQVRQEIIDNFIRQLPITEVKII